ncbi:MAG: helix-turn-helix domain-containing protein [Oscillospiraceae bacterium]|nr:helix-turn-helix domain-containing protein [Oscillospiraceae bacterium]
MSKDIPLRHRDRFFQIGIAISTLRRVRGMSQEELAEKANISRSLISAVEAPSLPHNFTLETLLSIADALNVDPSDLLNASMFPDNVINKSNMRIDN